MTLISKDDVSFTVSKNLLLKYSGLIRAVFANEISNPHSSETVENQVLHITEISSDILSIVLEYMKLKEEKQEKLQITDLPIETSKILDVMSAALFFDC